MNEQTAVDLKGRHLVVGLPCYTGVVPVALMEALIRTTNALRQHGVTMTISTRTGSGIVDKVRDEIIHSFVTRTQGTDLLFLDDDIVFEPDDVLRLMAWATTREVVCGPYCTKDDRPTFHYGLRGDEHGKIIQDGDGLLRCMTAPAGFMLLRRSAIERMRDAYPGLRYQPKRGEFKGETVSALCLMHIGEQPDGTRSRIGEDIALCRRWTAIGGEIWLDPVIELGHVGRKEYRHSYVDWLRTRQERHDQPDEQHDQPAERHGTCRHGQFTWLGSDTFIGKSMELYGEWAEAELQTLLPLLREGDTVIDVGANIGTHTVPFAATVRKGGRVYAFEPQARIHEMLQGNVLANSGPDTGEVTAVLAGCSDVDGSGGLPAVNYQMARNFGAVALGGRAGNVRLYKLDTYPIAGPVRLIKIDVEGMESAVLRGAANLIAEHRPVLFVENNKVERARGVISAIMDVARDYKLYWHVASYFKPNNWRGNNDNIFARYRPEFNMLAVPHEINIDKNDPALVPVDASLDDWRAAHKAWFARTARAAT